MDGTRARLTAATNANLSSASFSGARLAPKNKLGQNFLVDLNLIDFIVKNGELTREDMVLEVGTGTGSLTLALAEQAGAVLSVEIDTAFHDLVRETLGHQAHVQLFHGDILHNKNHINPHVLTKLRSGFERFGGERLKLIANLPYVVATPVISNFILGELPFERMVVTVQWEIAERMMANPGTKNYGALAILVQSLADVELLRKLPPTVFWPRRKCPRPSSALFPTRPSEP